MISIWTVLALILMVALGGFISYFGDIQGTRWGKKRVHWFGMRPKRTAQVITALTGAGISALSIITVLLVSPTIRKMVIHGEQIIAENRTLLHRLTGLRTQYENEIRQREASNSRLAEQQVTLLHKNQALELKSAELERKGADLAQQVVNRVARIETLITRQTALEHQKLVLEARLTSDRNQIRRETTWNKEVSDRNLALTRNSDDLEKKLDQLTSVRDQLVDETTQLKKDQETLQSIKAALTTANEARAQANDEMQARNNELEANIARLKANQTALEEHNHSLVEGLMSAEQQGVQDTMTIRRGRMNFRRGEMIARCVIDSHQRPERVRTELNQLLDDAGVMASIRSAGRGENGRTVRIVTTRTMSLAGIQDADENDTLKALVDSLAGQDTPVVVMANVMNNTVVGEQVVIDLATSPISQAFKRGDVVASTEMDATQSANDVYKAIVTFLDHGVMEAAIKAGIVPHIDPQSGTETRGNVGPSDMLQLTERIRRMGGQVLVTAVARKAVTSTDLLSLDFKVTRVAPEN